MHGCRRILRFVLMLGVLCGLAGLRAGTPSTSAAGFADVVCSAGASGAVTCVATLNLNLNAGGSFKVALPSSDATIVNCDSVPAGSASCTVAASSATFLCPSTCAAGNKYQVTVQGALSVAQALQVFVTNAGVTAPAAASTPTVTTITQPVAGYGPTVNYPSVSGGITCGLNSVLTAIGCTSAFGGYGGYGGYGFGGSGYGLGGYGSGGFPYGTYSSTLGSPCFGYSYPFCTSNVANLQNFANTCISIFNCSGLNNGFFNRGLNSFFNSCQALINCFNAFNSNCITFTAACGTGCLNALSALCSFAASCVSTLGTFNFCGTCSGSLLAGCVTNCFTNTAMCGNNFGGCFAPNGRACQFTANCLQVVNSPQGQTVGFVC